MSTSYNNPELTEANLMKWLDGADPDDFSMTEWEDLREMIQERLKDFNQQGEEYD